MGRINLYLTVMQPNFKVMYRPAFLIFALFSMSASAGDSFIQMTNWNTDIAAAANRPVFMTPLLYSNNIVGPMDVKKYTSDSSAAFYVSNQISGYYKFEIQAPPNARRMFLRVPVVSGKWTPTINDWDFSEALNITASYTRDQTDARITAATNGLSGGGGAGVDVGLLTGETNIVVTTNSSLLRLLSAPRVATTNLVKLSTNDLFAAVVAAFYPLASNPSGYLLAPSTVGLSNSVIAQFGAVGGDADDTTAFQAAADSGADVFVPAITNGYTVSNIILKNNSHLRGGGSARLKMKSTATGKFVYAQSSAVTNIIFTGFVLDGQGVGATGSGGAPWTFTAGYAVVSSFSTDRSGLYLYNNQTNSFISDLLVKNFSNKGIWIEGALGTFPQPTSHTLSGYDLRLENCYQGILFTNSAEYCSFSDVNCFHCGEAVAIWSGNVSIRGGVMTRNGCGFRVVGSGVTNPAHGSVEDVVLNHNDVAILCTDFNNGFNFNNLIILGGGGEGGGNPIFLTNTCGVNIQNSTLNSGMFASADGGSASANGYNYIDHCKVTGHVPIFQTSSGHFIYNEAVDYSVLTAPKVTNNFAMSFGSPIIPLAGIYGGVITNNATGLNISGQLSAITIANTDGGGIQGTFSGDGAAITNLPAQTNGNFARRNTDNSFQGTTSNGVVWVGTNGAAYLVGNSTNNTVNLPSLTANQILAINGSKNVGVIAGTDISTVLHGGTPPAFQQVALATDVSGTLPDGQLSSNVGLLNRNPQTWTGVNNFQTVTSTALNVTGAVGLNGPVNFTNTVTHQSLVTNAAAVYGTVQTNTGAIKASEFVGDISKCTGGGASTTYTAATGKMNTGGLFGSLRGTGNYGNSVQVASANDVYAVLVYVPASFTIANTTWYIGTTDSGKHAGLGIYDVSGNKLWSDTVSTTSGGAVQHSATGYTVATGFYYLAYTYDSTTASCYGAQAFGSQALIQNISAGLLQVFVAGNPSVAGVPPATLGTRTADYSKCALPEVTFD